MKREETTAAFDRTLTYKVTPSLIKTAAWSFWRSYIGVAGILMVVVPAAVGIYLLATGSLGGELLLFVALGGVVMFILGGLTSVRRGNLQLRRMKTPEMMVRFTPERLEIRSDLGSAQLPWSSVERIRQYPTVWLLMLSRVNYLTLPADRLDPELRGFIMGMIRNQGESVAA